MATFDELWDATTSPQPTNAGNDFDKLWSTTPVKQVFPGLPVATTTGAPSWEESTKFVGKSMAEGLGELGAFAQDYNPLTMPFSQASKLLTGKSFGERTKEKFDTMIGAPEATDAQAITIQGIGPRLAKAAAKGAIVPVGGPVINAVAGLTAQGAQEAFPESDVAPFFGGLLGATGGGLFSQAPKLLSRAGAAFERSSIGAGVKDYAKSLKQSGIITAEESGELSTKLGKAINDIGSSEGWGIIRTPERLLGRIKAKMEQYGAPIGEILSKVDEQGITTTPKILDKGSATQSLLQKGGAQKKQIKGAIDEFLDDFTDPETGWDGTIKGLNDWKKSLGERAWSGTAKGTLTAPTARKVQRALFSDIENAIDDAVQKSGTDLKTYDFYKKKYGDYAQIYPVIAEDVAAGEASTLAKTLRLGLRTSGGFLTTPALIAGALGGAASVPLGIAAGATLGALTSPTGAGITGNLLKAAGGASRTLGAGANFLNTLPAAAFSGAVAEPQRKELPRSLFRIEGGTDENSSLPVIPLPAKKNPMDTKKLDPLTQAMIRQESNRNPNAVSRKGAMGLMQLMPETAAEVARELGVENYDLKDPETSLQFGQYYFDKMLKQFGGDVKLALAAYNAGPGKVAEWIEKYGSNWDTISKELEKRKQYKETRNYVPGILSKMNA